MSPDGDRLTAHTITSVALAAMSDPELTELLARRGRLRVGIGGSTQAIRVEDKPVFVKLVHVSDLGRAAGSDCTENLFGLPT